MLGRKSKVDTKSEPERPRIYVTPKGKLYVKPDELLRSEIGRQRVQEMVEFAEKQKRVTKTYAETNPKDQS